MRTPEPSRSRTGTPAPDLSSIVRVGRFRQADQGIGRMRVDGEGFAIGVHGAGAVGQRDVDRTESLVDGRKLDDLERVLGEGLGPTERFLRWARAPLAEEREGEIVLDDGQVARFPGRDRRCDDLNAVPYYLFP